MDNYYKRKLVIGLVAFCLGGLFVLFSGFHGVEECESAGMEYYGNNSCVDSDGVLHAVPGKHYEQ